MGPRAPSLWYICPQSSFKLHPEFDGTVAQILRNVPHSHVVFLEARREQWSQLLKERMNNFTMTDVFAQTSAFRASGGWK